MPESFKGYSLFSYMHMSSSLSAFPTDCELLRAGTQLAHRTVKVWGVGLTKEGSWEMGLDRQAAYEVFNGEVGLGQTSLQNRLEGVGQPPQEARTSHPPP